MILKSEIQITTGFILCSSVWKVTLAMMVASQHLRLEPSGMLHAFFTGQNFFVTCSANEHSGATRLTWQGPSGTDITVSHGRVHVEPAPHNPQGLELVVEEVKFKDKGTYTCSAVVDGKEVRTHFSLLVHQSIAFLGTPVEQRGIEENDFLVLCNVRSDPPSIITWYVNNSLILNDARHTLTEDGLYIRNLRRSDAGNYTCRAFVVTRHNSQMKDIFIKLDVHYRPVWRSSSMEVAHGMIGHTAHLMCEAHAKPAPVFEWFRERTLLGNSRIYRIINHNWKSILQVKIEDGSAFGNYHCVVSNSLGEIRRSIALFEGVYPSPPAVFVYSKEPGTLLVKLERQEADSLPVLGYRIQYRLQYDDWSNAKEYYIYKEDDLLLQELNLESEYVVRAKARNEVGYGNYSREVSLRTKGVLAETVMDGHGVASSSPSNAAASSRAVSRRTFSRWTALILAVIVAIYHRRWGGSPRDSHGAEYVPDT